MAALFMSLAKDAANNFTQLFRFREESVVAINEAGKEEQVKLSLQRPENPIYLLKLLNFRQWMLFHCCFLAILADLTDFQLLSIQAVKLAIYYNTTKSVITTSITYTLLLRPVGAILFGFLSDYYGRKWPLFISLIIMAGLQIATVYCHSLPAFMAVRALFGIAMGSVWGSSAALAMEGCPAAARGLVSGCECVEGGEVNRETSLKAYSPYSPLFVREFSALFCRWPLLHQCILSQSQSWARSIIVEEDFLLECCSYWHCCTLASCCS
jgi:hypothetical protein